MADQIVITEKSSQANDVRAAVGSRYGVSDITKSEQATWLRDPKGFERMARQAGCADLPLHGGHVPGWLADKC
jgi:hypothetical protein